MTALGDRAYADAMLRMRWLREPDARPRLAAELEELRRASRRCHEALRDAIARSSVRGAALRREFDAVVGSDRDHFVEEVLGIAYPPFEEMALEPELIAYTPSSYDEIVHAFDVTHLGAGQRFVDVGSGLGKAVLLAALLTGASATGIEIDGALHDEATRAAGELTVDARFLHEDARVARLEPADVAFLYIPFTGATLAAFLDRLEARFVCSSALDLGRFPRFVATGAPRSWLQVYARR